MCIPPPPVKTTVPNGSSPYCFSSLSKDLNPPLRLSISMTHNPLSWPVKIPILALGHCSHQLRICFSFVVASFKPLNVLGCLPGLRQSALPQEHLPASLIS